MIGSRLGVYEIGPKLGAGAMGEVYRARDTRLGRDVAIKVLPAAFTQDPDRLARFEREAKLLASLNHPNIATIYGLEESDGIRALVMELIDGEDLGRRIKREPLPVPEVLEIAGQIASALDAAHKGGVIHRDLKPANILITPDRTVKILDFGLAKSSIAEAVSGPGGSAASMTRTSAGTAAGMILGTAAYMSPEQARGKAVDRRTDVWAFACVVFEMLSGKSAFDGETVTDVLAAIVHKEPDWSLLPSAARPRLERLLRRCLVKDQRERVSDLGDVALVLREIGAEKAPPLAEGATLAATKQSRHWIVVAAVALLALVAGTVIGSRFRAHAPVTQESVAPGSFKQLTATPGQESEPAISPDGQSFAYVAGPAGHADIYLQRIDGRNAVNLTAGCAQDDVNPAFSPDGRLIAYHSDCAGGGLFVMGATGESARKVSDTGYSPAWSPNGREIAVVTEQLGMPWGRSTTSVLSAVALETGKRRVISEHDAMQPSWSPDGKRIAFWGMSGGSQRDLYTVPADGSQSAEDAATRLTNDPEIDWSAVWSADGRRLHFSSTRGGTFNLWSIAVDPNTGGAAGAPVPVTVPSSWAGWISLSRDGRRLIFVDRSARRTIQRAPLDAARGELAGPPVPVPLGTVEVYGALDMSADGTSIVFSNSGLPQYLFVVRADGSGLVQLTDGPHRDRQGVFSPDGQWIAFQTNRAGGHMALIHPDGSGLHVIPSELKDGWYPTWSPDGRRLAIATQDGAYFLDPKASSAKGSSERIPGPSDGDGFWPSSFSPDGRRLLGGLWNSAGVPTGSAVRSLSDGAQQTIRDTRGRGRPRFLPDGRRIVISLDDRLVVHDPATGQTRDLLTVPAGHSIDGFVISRDGKWIAWLDTADESDIWMATFDGAGPAEP